MMDALERQITGAPVTVKIRGVERTLSYPLHAVIVYQQQTGDSLFDKEAWKRVDLKEYPERWLACLWAGLHERQADGKWKEAFSLDELGALVDFSNAGEISEAMGKAIAAHFPKPAEDDDPKAQPDPRKNASDPDIPRSSSSGHAVATATDSAA